MIFEPEEIQLLEEIRVARFYGIPPQTVEDMPAPYFEAALNILWADNQNQKK